MVSVAEHSLFLVQNSDAPIETWRSLKIARDRGRKGSEPGHNNWKKTRFRIEFCYFTISIVLFAIEEKKIILVRFGKKMNLIFELELL